MVDTTFLVLTISDFGDAISAAFCVGIIGSKALLDGVWIMLDGVILLACKLVGIIFVFSNFSV